jgi:L-lactate permease
MPWAAYQQSLDPLNNPLLSTAFAALPVLVLFWLLVPRRWLASKAGAAGAVTAIVIAWLVYGMSLPMACMAFVSGAGFGLLPVGWTIFNAMLLYNITVATGQFSVVRRSVAGLSGDARIQAVLIGFAFGAFLEGAAGGGTPVAICGAILVGLGFDPFLAAVICLIANTSPVAYGGLGTPLITLNGVTDIPTERLSIMAGHQLPLLSFLVPLYMVKVMCTWKQTFEVWPALLVSGGSFAVFQFTFATIHAYVPDLVLYPMTDIGGGIFSLVVTAIFLRFWKPRHEWHFGKVKDGQPAAPDEAAGDAPSESPTPEPAGHSAEAAALVETAPPPGDDIPLNSRTIAIAWGPYVIMSVLLMLTGLVRQKEVPVRPGPGPVRIVDGLTTNYQIPVPLLHGLSHRDEYLHAVRTEHAAAAVLASASPLEAAVNLQLAQRYAPRPEGALFNFAWLTAPGTAVFVAALLSIVMLRMSWAQVKGVCRRTVYQMKVPIPTIACMLGLSYVTRYAGMDATLGVAFAATGLLYPFFAAILGWLGVFLTGTDAGSNALFGSLQKITATQVYANHPGAFAVPTLDQAQVLICTANSTGGVMGKMIDAQSICVATAATHQVGKEADIFKAVVWHSIVLATVVGLITLLQAYVYPFSQLVP